MRRLTWMLAVFVAGILTTAVSAQQHPDFSGAWTAVPSPPTSGGQGGPRGTLGSGWGESFTILQHNGILTLERLFFSRNDLQPPLKFRYSLDGGETRNTVLMGRGFQEQISTAAWEGEKLVITTVHTFQNPQDGRRMTIEVKQTLSLEPTQREAWPPSLVVETVRGGVLGGRPSTTRTVYTKNF